jgi:murein DD-endopeptidase MepM/ murein hydrolase activator NlpD
LMNVIIRRAGDGKMHCRLAVFRALAGAALLALSAPALAGEAAVDADAGGDAAAPPPVHITISRAADLQGRPAYAVRSDVAQGGSQILLSYVRPRINLAAASAPRGLPLSARALTSGFGMRVNPVTGIYAEHTGVDLAAPMGTPIVATAGGVVGTAGWTGGYGLMVAVENGGGLETRYAHMSRILVLPGSQVRAGDVLGYVGSTGRSTGPHLHYEMRFNGRPIDPLRK